MDLTRFTKEKDKAESKEEIILENDDVKITKIADEIEFFLKSEKALEKYKDYLFFATTNSIITQSDIQAQDFFEKSIEDGTEGLMFKNLNSSYTPGLRTGAMVKLKETKDPIDVVIVGATHGTGKRAGFYSSFFVAVKNENYVDDKDQFLVIGKVSSGIKEIGDEGGTLSNLTNLLKPLEIKEERSIVYFKPQIIIEVKYQEIQKSTTYESGYALRFPRILRLREDKDINQINSIEDIQKSYI